MHPRYVNYCCDFFLFLPFIGIFTSVFFSFSYLSVDILTLDPIVDSWSKQPLSFIQKSQSKTCRELGMNDLISYEWPGTLNGCVCYNKTRVLPDKCSESQNRRLCKNLDPLRPFISYKWKEHYICGMSAMKKATGYFDMVKIKSSDFCASGTKKCGRLDTLGNLLCVPENENCPINDISVESYEDSTFEIKASNIRQEDGSLIVEIVVTDEGRCANRVLRNMGDEGRYILFNYTNSELLKCRTFALNGTKVEYDTHYKLLDFYMKRSFYKQTGIANHIKHLPTYPNSTNKIGLYSTLYVGWKKECEKKEFMNFVKNTTYVKSEVNDILKEDYKYKFMLYGLTGVIVLLFLVGIYDMKYRLILTKGYKVEVDGFAFFCIGFFYLAIGGLCGVLIFLSQKNLDVIRQAENATALFELIGNNQCSDNKTNFVLKVIADEFFSYENKYFNIKTLSIFEIVIVIILISYMFFSKRHYDWRREKKERQINFYNFD